MLEDKIKKFREGRKILRGIFRKDKKTLMKYKEAIISHNQYVKFGYYFEGLKNAFLHPIQTFSLSWEAYWNSEESQAL